MQLDATQKTAEELIQFAAIPVIFYDIVPVVDEEGAYTIEELTFCQLRMHEKGVIKGSPDNILQLDERLNIIIASMQNQAIISPVTYENQHDQVVGNKLVPVSSYDGSIRDFVSNPLNSSSPYHFVYNEEIATVFFQDDNWYLALRNPKEDSCTKKLLDDKTIADIDMYIAGEKCKHAKQSVAGAESVQPIIGEVSSLELLEEIRKLLPIKADIKLADVVLHNSSNSSGRIKYSLVLCDVEREHLAAIYSGMY